MTEQRGSSFSFGLSLWWPALASTILNAAKIFYGSRMSKDGFVCSNQIGQVPVEMVESVSRAD